MNAPARVTLVTGGGKRVGAAIVRACAERGDAVVIHASSSVDEAETVAGELRAHGALIAVVQGDLRDAQAPARVVQEAAQAFGRLDVLVNSAATFVQSDPMSMTAAQWDLSFAVNVRAPFFLSQAFARRANKGGVIVNIADHLAFETTPAMVAHGAGKSALVHMTRTLARALAPDIRVNAVVPGLVCPPDSFTEEDATRFLRGVPLGRAGTPYDVAHAVCWLIDAPYVTGAVVPVDGGRGVAR